MSKSNVLNAVGVSLACVFTGSLLAAPIGPLAATQESLDRLNANARFSIGPVFRGGMNVTIRGSSYAQTLGLDGLGNATAYDDRFYDNGYAGKDSSLGGGIAPNTTWNWGYSDPGQYNADSGTLSFHKQGVPRYPSLASGGIDDDILATGLQASLGVRVTRSNRLQMHLLAGFQGIWGDTTVREQASLVTVTDAYDVAGTVPFPSAGHRGAFDGPFDSGATPPYTVIPNLPKSRSEAPFSAPSGAQSRIAFQVDQAIYVLSLSPQISFAPSSRLSLNLAPRISMNVIDVEVGRSETFMFADGTGTPRSFYDKADKRSLRLGVGLTAGAEYDLGKGWLASVFGGYEWVPDKTTLAVGPNTVTLDAGGWVAGLQIGKNF